MDRAGWFAMAIPVNRRKPRTDRQLDLLWSATMMQFARWTTLVGSMVLFALASVAGADEEKIPVKELPKAVRKAVKTKFPGARIAEAIEEEEDGKTTYEVVLKVQGRSVDVALKADGTILEIEKEIPVQELPRAVKKTLAARYPHAKIAKAEVVTKGEHGKARYEISITTEVVLSAQGKLVEPEDEEEDDEKPAAKSRKEKEDDDEKPAAKSRKEKEDDDDDKPAAKSKKTKKARDKDDDDEDDDD